MGGPHTRTPSPAIRTADEGVVGREAATWRLMGQESEHAPPEQAVGGRAIRQTPLPAISMVSEGAEWLSAVPVQRHPAPREGRTVGC